MDFTRHAFFRCLLVIFLGLTGAGANAQVTAEVMHGLDWLRAQVQVDGSITSAALPLATDTQTRGEVIATLAEFDGPAGVPVALLDHMTGQPDESSEVIARQVIARSAASSGVAALATALAERQQVDGGYQPYAGFGSTLLDTLWAYQGMARAGAFSTSAEAAARSFVLAQMQPDGSIGSSDTGQPRVQVGALGVLALRYARSDLAVANALSQLTAWLQRMQQADGGWDGSAYITAMALQALSVQGADAAARANARAYLMARQSVDGSWDGDAFLTAVILRAVMVDPAATPQSSSIWGLIFDPVSGTPVGGVQVALSGDASSIVTSGADGRFNFAGLASGSFTLNFTKAGYASASRSAVLGYGQNLDLGAVLLSPAASAGIVKGRVVAAATGLPLAGASVVLTGGSTASTRTDAAGNYEIVGVPAGVVTISVSLTTFATASGTGEMVAGQTLVFSPALFAEGAATPSTGQLLGKIVAADTGAPLAGAIIELNGATAVATTADGRFAIAIAPQSYALRIAAAGYDAVQGTLVLSAGAVIDLGTISLAAERTVTTITGRVTDQSTGLPVAGAEVSVIGGAATTSGSDGTYTLNNLAGTVFDLRVSANAYASQTWQLQVERPSLVIHDFALAAQPAAAIDLVDLRVSPQTVGAQTPVTMAATVVNNGTAEQEVVLTLQVQDQSGQIVAMGAAFTSDGAYALGAITLVPGERRAMEFQWNSGQFPPGGYQLVAHASEAGSFTSSTPIGRALITRAAALQITGTSRITGSVTANPSVLRAGTNTTVELFALIQNASNVELPAQNYRLQVIDESTGAVVNSSEVVGETLAVNQLLPLTFADWVPTAGGNFRLEVGVAASPLLGTLTGKLYVGDAATASYTVDKAVVLPGNQTVRGTLLVTGQDAATGTISDPLAGPIKTAIQKGVTYGDVQASIWAVNNKCLGCHVVTQALVGGELTRDLATYNNLQRNTLFNALSTFRQSSGAVYASHPEYAKTQTTLALWALNSWRKKNEIGAGLSAAADFMLSRQATNGSWSADHSSGWWSAPAANTAFNLKSLTEVIAVLEQVPTPVTYTSQVLKSGGGVSGAYTLTKNSAGQVIVANYTGGTVMAINPDGSAQTLVTGLGQPYGLLQMPDGALLIGTTTGVRRWLPGATTTSLFATAPGSAYGMLALGPDDNIYMSSAANDTIYRITPAGVVTPYLTGGLLNGPTGLSFDGGGNLIVGNYYNRNLLRVRPDKSTEVVVSWTNGNPRTVVPFADGWLVGTTTGAYIYNADWQGDRIAFSSSEGLVVMDDDTIVRSDGAATVSKLVPVAIDTAAKIAAYATAIGNATTWLLNDGNIAANSNLQAAHRLIGLGSAKTFYVGTPLADTISAKMVQVGNTLRSRQRADGGWGNLTTNASDSMVTAQVGFALDYLDPSPDDPVVQNAIKLLLARQQADGSWVSENGILATRLAATTWVEIWLPIALDRIGGIDADVTLRFAPNVTLSNPSLAPTLTTSEPDGSTTRKWQLAGVTSASRSIAFDLGLSDMRLDESRPVSTDAFLTFRNSFTNESVDAPITIPRVAASAFLGIGVSTDRTEYGTNAPVAITAQVGNLGVAAASGTVEFVVAALDGGVVANLGRVPFGALAVNATASVFTNWNTSIHYAGQYLVVADLYDSANGYVATARSALAIVPGNGVGVLTMSGSISTDKANYAASDVVRLTDRIDNRALNQNAAGLRAETSVLNPDGSPRWSVIAALSEIVAGSSKDLYYSLPLNVAPSGPYTARLIVRNEAGAIVASDSTVFEVQSTATTGTGLTGTLQANPDQAPLGESVNIVFNATNGGNAALAALPLTVKIVDPVTEQVVASFPYSTTLSVGATYASAASWLAAGTAGTTLVAVLSADVGGHALVLAQDNFTLIEPPVRLALDASAGRDTRLLVLVSCRPGAPVNGNASPEDLSCVTTRSQWLASYLASLGINHHISTTAEDFASELYCGRYDIYWVSGGAEKLSATLAKEVREAVRRGAGLLMDGVHDERNGLLDEIPGVSYRGKLPLTGYTVNLEAPLFNPASLTAAGTALKYDLAGGLAEARFPAADANPAIVVRAFGAGRATLFAFDLVGSLQVGGWSDVFLRGLADVEPAPASVHTGGAWVPLVLSITNQANPVTLIVTAQLPAGVALDDLPLGASLDASGNPVWALDLATDETRELSLALRAPAFSGPVRVNFVVSVVRNSVTSEYDQVPIEFLVEAAATVGPALQAALVALAPATAPERNARDRAAAAVQSGLGLLTQNKPADAVVKFVGAADDLSLVTSVATTAPALSLARLMAEAEAGLCDRQPLCDATTPKLVNDGLFSTFAATEGVQAQSGLPDGTDSDGWEWALGTDIASPGARSTAEHNWISGRNYGWKLGIDSAGQGSLEVTDDTTTLININLPATTTARLHSGNGVQIGVRATREAGLAKIDASVTRLQGSSMVGGLSTLGDGDYSEAQLNWLLPSGTAATLDVRGTVRLIFPGTAPPPGAVLRFTLNAGTAQCRAR
ncbi:MAG: carboxypeptidase regulatory-like domain-containing protein [Porticoccaceae bacterium]